MFFKNGVNLGTVVVLQQLSVVFSYSYSHTCKMVIILDEFTQFNTKFEYDSCLIPSMTSKSKRELLIVTPIDLSNKFVVSALLTISANHTCRDKL